MATVLHYNVCKDWVQPQRWAPFSAAHSAVTARSLTHACRLDQNKVVVYGVGVFTGITTALFPLSVVKTNQMADPKAGPGFTGAVQTAQKILTNEGVRGLYKGFGTVVAGAIPVCLPRTERVSCDVHLPWAVHSQRFECL